MQHLYARVGLLFVAMLLSPSLFSQQLNLSHLSTYNTGVFDEGAAEIVAYDKNGQRLFFVNGDNKSFDVLDISDPASPSLIQQVDITPYGGNLNSLDIYEDLVAVAIEADNKQDNGVIAFFDTDGNFLNSITAGALPDMVTFTPDGQKVIAANEGEPDDDYVVDPEGSITIIDLSAGVASATATQITLEGFNDKKASLMNRGIRIFGNNGTATVAQDMEPEYVTISPDGTTAYVACQENNALLVVDIETASILDFLALGYKDHTLGEPIVTEYRLNEIPWFGNYDLGTPLFGGETVKLGGFSGLCYDPLTSTDNQLSFWAVPDRGPNESTVNAGLSQNLRPFKLPNYEARLEKLIYIKSLDQFFIDANPIFLKRADGTPISGKGNIPGFDEVPVTRTDANVFSNADYTVNGVDYHALEYDAFGGDFEGVIRTIDYDTKDFSFWLCDEYRPAIYHFDANGILIDRFVAEGTSLLGDTPQPAGFYGTETLPAVYSKRRANRGFEAIAWDHDENIIYAFIQSPMENPGRAEVRNNSDVIRILGINPENGQPVKEFVYLLERNKDAGVGLSRVDKIGDAVYAGNGIFYILERDSSTPDDGDTGKKYVFEINTKGATNILGTPLSEKSTSTGDDDKTLEMMSADDLMAAGIQPVFKRKVVNLPSIGYLPSDKPEGLAIIPGGDLVVLNDNDFGLAGAGVSDNSSMGFIRFQRNYGFDASNRDDAINIAPRPTLGMYQPDAITSYAVNGKTYIVTANEGDARDYDGYSEEGRGNDLVLDDNSFADAMSLLENENLGRLNTTFANGDIDNDGMHEYFFSYGARSFSIWDEFGNLVFDSGDEFEQIIARDYADNFNSTNDDNDSQDNRSDDKGPEPEAVTIASFGGTPYAFIGLERIGGVMVYDISDPKAATYVTYINNRNFDADAETEEAGDLGVEDIVIIDAADSPNGISLMVTANEVSGTVSLFTITENTPTNSFVSNQPLNIAQSTPDFDVTPNPFKSNFVIEYVSEESFVNIDLYDQLGRLVTNLYQGNQVAGAHRLEVNLNKFDITPGMYVLSLSEESKETTSIKLIKD